MKVIWAYRDWSGVSMRSGNAGCDLRDNPFELFAFKASVLSWIKFAPEFTRTLYVDYSTYDFIRFHNLLPYFDEINIVDFAEKLEHEYKDLDTFFAYPKLWVLTQQSEPFFICDTDLVLLKPISEWFKPEGKNSWIYRYPDGQTDRILTDSSEMEIQTLISVSKSSPFLSRFCNYTNTVNAGLIWFPSEKVGQVVGYCMLEAGVEIGRALKKLRLKGQAEESLCWTLYEESLYQNLLEFITNEKIQVIPTDSYREYSGVVDISDAYPHEDFIKHTLNMNILGSIDDIVRKNKKYEYKKGSGLFIGSVKNI